jgi:hypothetical protein
MILANSHEAEIHVRGRPQVLERDDARRAADQRLRDEFELGIEDFGQIAGL